MPFKVAIRENATGEIRIHQDTYDWDEGMDYMWIDGNYSCDCNRHLMFHRAAGTEPSEDRDCGDTAYTALYAELPDGTRIELDEQPFSAEGSR